MKTLLKLDQAIETIQTWFCALMFIMILIFGTIQVFGRFVLSSAPPWTEEAMRFCGIYLTFIGSALTVRADAHVSVDILIGFLKDNKIRAGLFVVSRLICVVYFDCIFPGAITLVQKVAIPGERLSEFPILTFIAAPAGIIMMLCAYASAIPKLARQYAKGEK